MSDEVATVVEGQPLTVEEAAELQAVRPLPVVTRTVIKAPVVKAPNTKLSVRPVAPMAKQAITAPTTVPTPPKPLATKPVADKPAAEIATSSPLADIVLGMPEGVTVTFTKLNDKQWAVTKGNTVSASVATTATGKKKAVVKTTTEMYKVFLTQDAGMGKSWHSMILDEKYALAQALGASWEQHTNPPIDLMRMTVAVLDKLGIKKYDDAQPTVEAVAPEDQAIAEPVVA
jgi:hypothetical protein